MACTEPVVSLCRVTVRDTAGEVIAKYSFSILSDDEGYNQVCRFADTIRNRFPTYTVTVAVVP